MLEILAIAVRAAELYYRNQDVVRANIDDYDYHITYSVLHGREAVTMHNVVLHCWSLQSDASTARGRSDRSEISPC